MKRLVYLFVLPILFGCGRESAVQKAPEPVGDEQQIPKPAIPLKRWPVSKSQLTTWTWTVNGKTFEIANLGWDEETENAWTIYDVTRIDDGSKQEFIVRKFVRATGSSSKDTKLIMGTSAEGEQYFAKIEPVITWKIEPTETQIDSRIEYLINSHLDENFKHRCLKALEGRDFSGEGNLLLRPRAFFHVDRITDGIRTAFEFDRNSVSLIGLATDITPELLGPPYFPVLQEELVIYLPMNRDTLKAVNPRFYDKEAHFFIACETAYLRMGEQMDPFNKETDDEASRRIDRYSLPAGVFTFTSIKLNTLVIQKESKE